jgi:hypothetical protein
MWFRFLQKKSKKKFHACVPLIERDIHSRDMEMARKMEIAREMEIRREIRERGGDGVRRG